MSLNVEASVGNITGRRSMDKQTLTRLCFDKVARAKLLVFLQHIQRGLAIGLERPNTAVGASDRLRDGITGGLVFAPIFLLITTTYQQSRPGAQK